MGLHPWHLEHHEQGLAELKQAATLPHVLAIGECGLDRVCTTNWDLQTRVFSEQIMLAEKVQKPIIIHCVRAYAEVIQLLDWHRVSVPVIFHGFNKKGVAERLVNKGYYLSFGAAILSDTTSAAAALKTSLAGRFLLETDDSAKTIADIYNEAAIIRKTTIEDIILQVRKNVQTVFKT